MNKYIADTMAVILHLEQRKMPIKTRQKFRSAEMGDAEIMIPAMVFAEIGYLSEKGKIDISLPEVEKYLYEFSGISELPMTLATIIAIFRIFDIPELHDRIIAAHAVVNNVPIITNDPAILSSAHVK